MYQDPQFWVFIAFIIFILLIFKPVKNIIIANLDKKINEIKISVDQAEKLKNEAQQTLSEIKKRQNEVKDEIQSIKNKATNTINLIEKDSQKKLNEQIKKRNEHTKTKIEQLFREANLEVHQYVVNNAIEATIEILKTKLDGTQKQEIIKQSIKELNPTLKL